MKLRRIVPLLLLLGLLGGCSGMSIEELYCLPKASEDYYDLQEALSGVLDQGYSYQAPASGARRESVQLVDLDQDGQDEAIAFFRSSQTGTVAAYIFARKDGAYTQAAAIDCPGSAVGSVDYADLDGSGRLELILTCQVSQAVTQSLQVVRYDGDQAETLLTASCGRYELVDLNEDGAKELFCITDGGADSTASVSYYAWQEGKLEESPALRLSGDSSGIQNIQQGTLDDGSGAVLVSSQTAEALVTDVYAWSEQKGLRQVDLGDEAQSQCLRGRGVYPQDVDGDGHVELPVDGTVPAHDSGTESYAYVRWSGLTEKGKLTEKYLAYYCFDEDWYLELPEAWDGNVSVEEQDETKGACTVHTVTFYRRKGSGRSDQKLLSICALWGADRQTEAEKRKLTSLYSDTDVILAAELPENSDGWEGAMTVAQVSERFHMMNEGNDDN